MGIVSNVSWLILTNTVHRRICLAKADALSHTEVSRGNHSLWQGGRGTESPEMQKTTPFSPVCWGERRFAVPPGLLLVCVLLSQDMRHVSMEARELSFPMPSAAAFHQTAALFGRCAGYSSPSSPVYTMIISRGAFVKLNPPQTKPFSLHTETRDFFFFSEGAFLLKKKGPLRTSPKEISIGDRDFLRWDRRQQG